MTVVWFLDRDPREVWEDFFTNAIAHGAAS